MIQLKLREYSSIPIDVDGMIPSKIAGLSPLDVAKLPVLFGNRTVPAGELFEVVANGKDFLHFTGETMNVHGIGRGMTSGTIHVDQSVGRHAGAGMSGGTLLCANAGDWLGAEMTGGFIEVDGRAGHQVGAGYRGSRRGMSGGRITIHGHAGDELGLRMRRGLIHVLGNIGDFCGAAMIAGTILVHGTVGERLGAGMKRGTIAVKRFNPERLGPGFQYACEVEEPFVNRYYSFGSNAKLYRGDLAAGGLGEVFVV
jgi:formylmethanofuran dehydrogenase subunit C